MQLRFLNNRLQCHGQNGWTTVPQAVEIINCKAVQECVYFIGLNVFIGDRGIFVLNHNVLPREGHSEELGVVKEIDVDVKEAVLQLIDQELRKYIRFKNGFILEVRNAKFFLVGFYKSEDDPSFYLIKDAINNLKPKDHYPYFEGHFFSPEYNPITGEYGPAKAMDPEKPIGEFTVDPKKATQEFQRQLIQEGSAELDINPLTKKSYSYNIEIILNQYMTVLNFTTGTKVLVPDTKLVMTSMHPADFLNTFLDWQYVKSIRVTIDK